jgi:hypothetical protein
MGNARFIRGLLPTVRYPNLPRDELIRRAVGRHHELVEQGGDRPSRRKKRLAEVSAATDSSNPEPSTVPAQPTGDTEESPADAVVLQIESAVGPLRSQSSRRGRGARASANSGPAARSRKK